MNAEQADHVERVLREISMAAKADVSISFTLEGVLVDACDGDDTRTLGNGPTLFASMQGAIRYLHKQAEAEHAQRAAEQSKASAAVSRLQMLLADLEVSS